MPTNLQALIRYQTLDQCLRNRFKPHSIADLIEASSEAIAEKTGVYKNVSERTIRDDIRIMRSDILGYNAPIKVSDGIYYYEDWNYSITKTTLSNEDVLKEVLELFKSNRNNFDNDPVFTLMKKIAKLLDVPLKKPVEISKDEYNDLRNIEPLEHTIQTPNISRADQVYNSFFKDKVNTDNSSLAEDLIIKSDEARFEKTIEKSNISERSNLVVKLDAPSSRQSEYQGINWAQIFRCI